MLDATKSERQKLFYQQSARAAFFSGGTDEEVPLDAIALLALP